MKRTSWLWIVVSVLFLLSMAEGDWSVVAQGTNDPQANEALLRAFWEAEAARAYDRMDQFFVENLVRHSAATSAVMPEVQVTNREEYVQFLQTTAAMFPDYYVAPQRLIAADDCVAFYATFVAPASQVEVPMAGYARFENGKIAELWVEWDNVTWNAQMGPAETPEQRNAAISRRRFEESWINQNTAGVNEFVQDGAEWCAANERCGSLPNAFRTRWLNSFHAAFPDLEMTIQQVVASGDVVFVEMRGRGTFSQALQDPMSGEMLAPTNQVEEWSFLWIGTYEDGLVVSEKFYWYWHNWPIAPPE